MFGHLKYANAFIGGRPTWTLQRPKAQTHSKMHKTSLAVPSNSYISPKLKAVLFGGSIEKTKHWHFALHCILYEKKKVEQHICLSHRNGNIKLGARNSEVAKDSKLMETEIACAYVIPHTIRQSHRKRCWRNSFLSVRVHWSIAHCHTSHTSCGRLTVHTLHIDSHQINYSSRAIRSSWETRYIFFSFSFKSITIARAFSFLFGWCFICWWLFWSYFQCRKRVKNSYLFSNSIFVLWREINSVNDLMMLRREYFFEFVFTILRYLYAFRRYLPLSLPHPFIHVACSCVVVWSVMLERPAFTDHYEIPDTRHNDNGWCLCSQHDHHSS